MVRSTKICQVASGSLSFAGHLPHCWLSSQPRLARFLTLHYPRSSTQECWPQCPRLFCCLANIWTISAIEWMDLFSYFHGFFNIHTRPHYGADISCLLELWVVCICSFFRLSWNWEGCRGIWQLMANWDSVSTNQVAIDNSTKLSGATKGGDGALMT